MAKKLERTAFLSARIERGLVAHVSYRHDRRAPAGRQEPYGYEINVNDARSERTAPHLTTDGFVNGSRSYRVREGDTLTSVANKFKVSVQSIASVNEIANVDYVPAGKILLIPCGFMRTGEVVAKAELPSNLESQPYEDKSVVQTESSLSELPAFASAFHFQSWHVRLALSLVLLLAISSLVRRYISGLRTRRHDEFVQYQVQKEVQEGYHQPKLRRWQGILDHDRKVDEVDGDLLAESRAVDVEEENLRQTYAQLESAYVKFLADSGLSKSGYWRGGVPPTLEEK